MAEVFHRGTYSLLRVPYCACILDHDLTGVPSGQLTTKSCLLSSTVQDTAHISYQPSWAIAWVPPSPYNSVQ